MIKDATEIGQLIDMTIGDFIGYVMTKNFSECGGVVSLLEIELGRIRIARTKLTDFEEELLDYVNTFVVEQKIIDRLLLTETIKKSKGVDLSIFQTT